MDTKENINLFNNETTHQEAEEKRPIDMDTRIEMYKRDIDQAIKDYTRHVNEHESNTIRDNITEDFIDTFATDAAYAKTDLRCMFRKSKYYDEDKDMLVIPCSKEKQPDVERLEGIAYDIFYNLTRQNKISFSLYHAILVFIDSTNEKYYNANKPAIGMRIDELIQSFPNVFRNGKYDPNQKKSRIIKAICKELGIDDESKNSEFQKNFAKLSDEMNRKEENFNLYCSINPAHFLTMSNPKNDRRGHMLTSCHSLNSWEYSYNNGCMGYATDESTMIVFTVDDKNFLPENLNNRKTSRQLFMYSPGKYILLQSRLYNTQGGTHGEQETSVLYRDIIQRIISELEEVTNDWLTYRACRYEGSQYLYVDSDFGGYRDWEYEDFEGKVYVNRDKVNSIHTEEVENRLKIGHTGYCLHCGEENSDGLFCDDCREEIEGMLCDDCGEVIDGESYEVHRDGDIITVCRDCYENDYRTCEHCGETYHEDEIRYVESADRYVCDDCLEEHYKQCDECYEYYEEDDLTPAYDADGCRIYICDDCRENGHYEYCEECDTWNHRDNMVTVYKDGRDRLVCKDCLENYTECDECGEYVSNDEIQTITLKDGSTLDVCSHCLEENYAQCDDCGKWIEKAFSDDDVLTVITDHDGVVKHVCDDCLTEKYVYCEKCEEYYDKAYMKFHEIEEDGQQKIICDDCYEYKQLKKEIMDKVNDPVKYEQLKAEAEQQKTESATA